MRYGRYAVFALLFIPACSNEKQELRDTAANVAAQGPASGSPTLEAPAEHMENKSKPPRLLDLTPGMIIGRALDNDIYDIAFPGDMLPSADVIAHEGKSAQIVYGIRIAEDQPILVAKLVHFSRGEPLGVFQLTATTGLDKPAVHQFPQQFVSRQSIDGGILEFATFLPFEEASAAQVDLIYRTSPANIEVKGTAGYTTFTPGITARQHANRMVTLYEILKKRPAFVSHLQQKALSYPEYLKALAAFQDSIKKP